MSFRQKSFGSKDSKDRLKHTELAFTCVKTTIEAQEKGVKYVQRMASGVFIINFEYISHLFLVFLLLALNK